MYLLLGKLARKRQIACKWLNKELVCFENLDKSVEKVKSARCLEDRRELDIKKPVNMCFIVLLSFE